MGTALITTGDRADNIATATLAPFAVVGAALLVIGVRWLIINASPLADLALEGVAAVGAQLPALPAHPAAHRPLHRVGVLRDDTAVRPYRVGVQPAVDGRGRHWAVGEQHDTGMYPTVQIGEDSGAETAEVSA